LDLSWRTSKTFWRARTKGGMTASKSRSDVARPCALHPCTHVRACPLDTISPPSLRLRSCSEPETFPSWTSARATRTSNFAFARSRRSQASSVASSIRHGTKKRTSARSYSRLLTSLQRCRFLARLYALPCANGKTLECELFGDYVQRSVSFVARLYRWTCMMRTCFRGLHKRTMTSWDELMWYSRESSQLTNPSEDGLL